MMTREKSSKKEGLEKIYVLKCLHETKYGNDMYVSIHCSRDDAMNYVAEVMKKSGYDADSEDEHFSYDCEEKLIDVSLLLKQQMERAERIVEND